MEIENLIKKLREPFIEMAKRKSELKLKEESKLSEESQKSLEKEAFIQKGEDIDLFPGSLENYCKLKNEKYEIIDTGTNEKYMFYMHKYISSTDEIIRRRYLEKIGRKDVKALIHYRFFHQIDRWDGLSGYGIPVRKTKH